MLRKNWLVDRTNQLFNPVRDLRSGGKHLLVYSANLNIAIDKLKSSPHSNNHAIENKTNNLNSLAQNF